MIFAAKKVQGNPKKLMRVLLRNTQTGWYYQEPSKWTPEQEAAYDLKQLSQAVRLAFENHLENVEILMSFDDPQFNLTLPITRPRA